MAAKVKPKVKAKVAKVPKAPEKKPRKVNESFTLKDLARAMTEDDENFSTSGTYAFLKEVFGVISQKLIGGADVSIHGFGIFRVTDRKARTGRNPQTGATIEIPDRKGVKFKASASLRDGINQ